MRARRAGRAAKSALSFSLSPLPIPHRQAGAGRGPRGHGGGPHVYVGGVRGCLEGGRDSLLEGGRPPGDRQFQPAPRQGGGPGGAWHACVSESGWGGEERGHAGHAERCSVCDDGQGRERPPRSAFFFPHIFFGFAKKVGRHATHAAQCSRCERPCPRAPVVGTRSRPQWARWAAGICRPGAHRLVGRARPSNATRPSRIPPHITQTSQPRCRPAPRPC